MTDIINIDLEKIIESSISELTKNLSCELNKKVREDVINNLMKTTTTKSIYGLGDIKDFGKIDVGVGDFANNIYDSSENRYFIGCRNIHNHTPNPTYLKLRKCEYPILCYTRYYDRHVIQTYYITNMIDNLVLDNDDILFLSLFLMGTECLGDNVRGYNETNKQFNSVSPITTKFIQENKLMGNKIGDGCHAILQDDLLKKSLKRYFASVHDNKIKAFEFDKLIENNKKLEVSINNILENKNKLDEKIIKLEEENYIYCKEILELEETIETKIELENNKQKETIIELEGKNKYLEEELNKTKEENIKLSDEWLILKDKTIAKFEEDNYKLRMEKDKLIKKITELEKKTE